VSLYSSSIHNKIGTEILELQLIRSQNGLMLAETPLLSQYLTGFCVCVCVLKLLYTIIETITATLYL